MKIIEKDHFYATIIYDEDEYDDFMKIYRYFAIKDPKLTHTAKVRCGVSDGKIKFVKKNGNFLKGLLNKIKAYMDRQNIDYIVDFKLTEGINKDDVFKFISELKLPFDPYDFQKNGVKIAVDNKQKIVLSATGSGKSYLLYILSRYLQHVNEQVLLVVPDVGLVNQMYNDFKDYAQADKEHLKDFDNIYHKIFAGQDKDTDHPVIISTWQSIYDLDKSHPLFKKTNVILSDECHLCSSDSYMEIFEKAVNTTKRIGVTGTLPEDLIEQLKLEGIFGTSLRIVSSRQLIEMGLATESVVQPVILNYDEETIQTVYRAKDWRYEQRVIMESEERFDFVTKFIEKLAKKNKGNVIVLFKNVDYGNRLYERLKERHGNTFLIKGSVSPKKREEIRNNLDKISDGILIGTDKIVSTGLNIKSLRYMVNTQNGKSEIKTIQSIGRLMRLFDGKDGSVLYDIVDNLIYTTRPSKKYPKGNKKYNYAYNWYLDRLDSYEKYDFIVKNRASFNLF